jgi:hypothetical protein
MFDFLFAKLDLWVVGVLALAYALAQFVKWYFTEKGLQIPEVAQEWIDKLGFDTLYQAYLAAENEASEPDAKRDVAAAYLQAVALATFGVRIPTSTANLLVEIAVNLSKHEGPATVEAAGGELIARAAQA